MSTQVHRRPRQSALGQASGSVSPVLAPVPTLADVIAMIEAGELMPVQKRDMVSALRTAARLFGCDPAHLQADPRSLRARFTAAAPAMAGLSAARWANIRSLVLAALRQAGIRVLPGRAPAPLSPAWDGLRAQLPNPRFRLGLSRFMSFCSAQAIGPDAVDTAVFDAFREALEHDSLVGSQDRVYRTTCVLWNRASELIEAWPCYRAAVPVSSRRYAGSWGDFPASFQEDARAFLHHSGEGDVLADDYARPVRASTVNMRRKQILQLATALVGAGYPVEDMTGLDVLVQVPNAKRILGFLLDRTERKPTKYLHQQAQLLKTVAQHWVRADAATVDILGQLCRRLSVKAVGMTDKNRDRLRQFDNPANVRALLNLPRRILDQVSRQQGEDQAGALRVMLALAVELLTVAPMRIDNLAGLEVERHILRLRAGGRTTVHIAIPAEETKNGVPYEVELPEDSAAFLLTYLARYHKKLAPGGSAFLFPTQAGGRRSTTPLATAISRFVLRETGIRMNVHLFRHLAAKLYLEARPEDVETARRILGHRNLSTTLRFYAETKTAASFRRFDGLIASLRSPAPPPPRGTRAVRRRT